MLGWWGKCGFSRGSLSVDTVVVGAVNHENDTYFGNGLVMGSADCKYYASPFSKHVSFSRLNATDTTPYYP